MTDKTRKRFGIGGAILVALGSGGLFLSGASVGDATGIVGLAFAVAAALASLIAGIKK
jgi:hypothetical protein